MLFLLFIVNGVYAAETLRVRCSHYFDQVSRELKQRKVSPEVDVVIQVMFNTCTDKNAIEVLNKQKDPQLEKVYKARLDSLRAFVPFLWQKVSTSLLPVTGSELWYSFSEINGHNADILIQDPVIVEAALRLADTCNLYKIR